MSQNRFRLRFTFWLDLHKPDEAQLADQIELLKNDRSFASTVRDGISLVCDLRAGRLDVLFELFPWFRAEFFEHIQSIQPPKPATQTDLERQLARLETLLMQQGHVSVSAALKPLSGPKPLSVPQFALPPDDDDDVVLNVKRDTTANSAQNFISSMLRLQQ